MSDQDLPVEPSVAEQRRRFLRLAGSAAALLPIVVVSGCGKDAAPPTPAAPASAPPARQAAPTERVVEAPPESVPEPEPPVEVAVEDLPQLDLNDPRAQALGYQHDASLVDADQFPQRDPAHLCSNCALYTGREGDEWGPCGLFPGKAVNANGWCNAWAPRRG